MILGRPYSITYRHADGRDYRHAFGRGAHLVTRSDGVVEVRSTRGRAWDSFLQLDGTTKPYLVNPTRGKNRRRHGATHMKKNSRRGNRATKKLSVRRAVKKARGVPAWVRARGFSSWASYFQSINKAKGGKRMAGKRRRKSGGGRHRRRAASAINPHGAARHHRRRGGGRRRGGFSINPFGVSPRGIVRQAGQLLLGGARDGVVGTVSLAGARIVRGKLASLEGNTPVGIGVELAAGLLQALVARRMFGENVGRAAMQGVTQGIVTTVVKGAGIPFISPGLGDEGELPLLSGIYDLSGVYSLQGGDNPRVLNSGDVSQSQPITVGADSDMM